MTWKPTEWYISSLSAPSAKESASGRTAWTDSVTVAALSNLWL